MATKNYYMEQPIGADGIAPIQNPSQIRTSPHGAFVDTPMGINVGQYFNNNTIKSKYVKELGDINEAIRQGRTVEDLLAEKQSGWEMAGNALLNNVVIAGTTLVSGTLGIVDGLFEAAANGDASKIWDNSVNNWAVDKQEAMKEAFPIYRGEEYNKASIWDKMGKGIFWADLVENLGFTEGMIVPGMAASKVLQGLGKGATMVGSAFVSSIGEGSIEAINARNDEVRNKTALANQKYNELSQKVSGYEELQDLYNEYQEDINNAVEDANNAGNFVLGSNIALLTLTNTLEVGNLFSRGFSTNRRLAGQLLREGNKYMADSNTKAVAKATGKKLLDAFSEGMEEVSQKAISGTSQYYTDYNRFNESIFNPEKRELVGNLISAFGKSYAETLHDPQTAEEFASGFLIGLTGAPQLRKAKIPVTVENNIIGEINKAYKNNKRERELADNINARLADSKEFNAYYDGLVRHLVLQDDINTAIDEADHTAYDNAKSAQLISDIMMFSDAGHLDHLRKLVNDSVDLSDEGVAAIIEETSKDGEGPFMNNGNKMSIEDARELIKRKQNYINHKIDFIAENKEKFEAAFPNLDETGISNVLFLKSQIEDHETRFNGLKDEVHAGIAKLFNSFTTKPNKSRKGTVYVKTEDGKKHYVRPEDIEYFDADGVAILKSDTNKKEIYPYKHLIPTEEQLIANLNNPVFGEIVQSLLNDDTSTMSSDERNELSEKQKDLGKLQSGLIELNKALSEAISNPEKTNNSKKEALDKTEKINSVKNDIKKKDKIANSNVSDIVQDVETGEIDSSELDGLFSEEDNQFLSKIDEAKKIISTSQRINKVIDDLATDPQTAKDAKTLLQESKKLSESEDEMLNTASQAFNDPDLLFDETDPSVQNMSIDDLEFMLGERMDAAKTLIEEAKSILQAENGELKNLPTNGKVVKKFTVEEAKETGHDATPTLKSENERAKKEKEKQAEELKKAENKDKLDTIFDEARSSLSPEDLPKFNAALSSVLSYLNTLTNAKATAKEIGNIIKGTQSYSTLQQLVPNIADYLNTYVSAKRTLDQQSSNTAQQEEQELPTPTITEDELKKQTSQQQSTEVNSPEPINYQYWKPTISYLPFGKAFEKGNNTPFYKIARSLTNANGTPMFTEQQLKRIEAVGAYLDNHGAFKLVDSGEVKAGDTVKFAIDSTLNDEAGEIVILMTDAQGRIIGDIMSPNDRGFDQQIGLRAFVDRITEAYKKAGSPKYYSEFSETTKVDKNKIGKVPYLADNEGLNSLNSVFNDGVKTIPFTLGISIANGTNARILASPGRTKQQGQSELEKTILPPLTAKAGQPFLLLPTSSSINHYIPVPILADTYNGNTGRTALGQAIRKILEKIPTSDNSNVMDIINGLEELITLEELHINYDGDNVKITIKPIGAEHQRSIYNGSKNAEDIVGQIEMGLQVQNLPFQISRKYINDTYEGQDYNRMIGEVAKVNLPIGTTHTISDWFTVNPIDAKGNILTAKSPRSIGRNPNAVNPTPISVNIGTGELSVNPKTWEVIKNGNPITGLEADKAIAQAYGIQTNQNMEKPYQSNKGYYDPVKHEFVEKPQVIIKKLGKEELAKQQETETPKQLEDKAKSAGILNNKVREALWTELTPQQQSKIANGISIKQEQWMAALENAFDIKAKTFDTTKLDGTIDEFLNRKALYRKEDSLQQTWNKEKELNWLSKVLPNLSTNDHLRIVDGLIKITKDSNVEFAWGMFENGIITLSNQAAEGTTYHEAFHAVANTLLSEDEYNTLFDEAKKKWGNIGEIELEENLAEDFRKYVQLEETPFIGTVVKIYRLLKHLVQNLFNKEPYINKLFYSINRGTLANRKVQNTDVTKYKMAEGFTGTIEEFQNIVDSLVNNPLSMKTRISKNKEWGRLTDNWRAEGYEVKGYWNNQTKKWTVASVKNLNGNNEAHYRKIEQYHRDKLLYNNLSEEDKNYLEEKGISEEEYANMSQLEKEVLFKCKY